MVQQHELFCSTATSYVSLEVVNTNALVGELFDIELNTCNSPDICACVVHPSFSSSPSLMPNTQSCPLSSLPPPPPTSAGIGRTGVFIGADVGMTQLETEGEVDVLKIVSTMRQDRGGMVQTQQQYIFLHQVYT